VPRILANRELAPKAEPTDWRLAEPAALAAVRRHVARHHQGWEVSEDRAGRVRIRPPLPDDTLVSVIIPTRDRADLLRACIDAIRRHTNRPRYELLVVDTGSTDAGALALLAELAAQRDVRVLAAPGRFNWSAANNLAARNALGNVLLFLNNDTEVQAPGWLEELAAWALTDGVGTVGALLCRADGTVQHAGVGLGFGGLCAHPFEGLRPDDATIVGPAAAYRSCVAVTGACLAVSRRVFDLLGGFEERFQVLFSDVELGVRAWAAGLPSIVSPHARLLHHHGRSRGTDDLMIPADILTAYDLIPRELMSSDPFWSPHLSRWSAIPRLLRLGGPTPLMVMDAYSTALRATFTAEQLDELQSVAPIFGDVWHRVAAMAVGGQD
jgi:GT2 family glycosyltransferase